MHCLVSVVIPTHKREFKYIKRSVESVLRQTYDNWELIIVDDNSELPEYRETVKNYVSQLNSDRIHLFLNGKNLGGSLTRNRGIEEASGEYIAFLDDDDAYLPNRIEDMLAFMVETDCDMAFSNLLMRNNDGKVVDFREHSSIKSFDNDYLLAYHLVKNISGTSSFMYRTEAIRRIGGFMDAKMGQDFHIIFRTLTGGLKTRYFNSNSVIIYKHSDGGISQGRNKIEGENRLYNFKKDYFDRLTKAEIRYVKFRHYAVMVVAYLRNRNVPMAMVMGIKAFFSAPLVFFKEVFGFFSRIAKHRDDIYYVPEEETKIPETITR